MSIRKTLKNLLTSGQAQHYLAKREQFSHGSAEWLIGTEIKYGGIVQSVARNKVSPSDPRSQAQLGRGGMVGGDRMLHHGYAKKYAEHLAPFLRTKEPLTMVEFGILKGTGLAIWSDLFPDARIIGFDIDLNHFESNLPMLESLGAFAMNRPELREFDQFEDNTELLGSLLGDGRIDVCMDDGHHSNESILCTMKSVVPYLADPFVYFIEDNSEVHSDIRATYPEYRVESRGEFTIMTRR